MNRSLRNTILIIILLMGVGCAKRTNWSASPEIQMGQNLYYEVHFEPLKTDKNFYYFFNLTVMNKTDGELKINWNKTQYLRNGAPNGVFIFEGIVPEDIKNLTIPDDIVPAGEKITKTIAPHKLLAWTPFGGRITSNGRINPGIVPAGRNGISLIIMMDGTKISERLEVNIKEREAE